MDWEVVRGNWAIIWALFMSGVNVIQLLLAKTYVKREELDNVRSRLQGLENAIATLPSALAHEMVFSAPDRTPASTTTTPTERAAISRLRCRKPGLVG